MKCFFQGCFYFYFLSLFGLQAQEHKSGIQGQTLTHFYLNSPEGKLHYQTIGDPSHPTLLLIHGSPGDVSAWDKMLKISSLLNHFYVVAIDRPAYGKTTLAGGSLSYQSNQLGTFMEQNCNPCVVAGHSYGAALALQLGVDYPQRVKSIVSIAGTIAAPHQRARWYNYIAGYTPLKWILPKMFKNSNKEMLLLFNDLTLLEKKLTHLNIPVVLYQGGKDILVPPESGPYIASLLPLSQLIFRPEKNHFVIWTDIPDLELLFLNWKESMSW